MGTNMAIDRNWSKKERNIQQLSGWFIFNAYQCLRQKENFFWVGWKIAWNLTVVPRDIWKISREPRGKHGLSIFTPRYFTPFFQRLNSGRILLGFFLRKSDGRALLISGLSACIGKKVAILLGKYSFSAYCNTHALHNTAGWDTQSDAENAS